MTGRSPMPAHSTDLKWRGASRKPSTRLLVVCGATGTEPQYIRALNSFLCNRAVHVKVIEKGRSPSQVVDFGIKKMTAVKDSYDELWCVVDVDNFEDLDAAARKAKTSGIRTTLIVSNPCFELWLVLHFADHRSYIDSPARTKQLLCRHVANYDKQIVDFPAVYAPRLEDASRRAKALDSTGEATRLNPSTNMWRLVVAMGA